MFNRYFTEIFPKPKAALKTKPTQPKKVSASILNFGIKYLSGHVRTYKYLQLAETRRNIGTEKTLTRTKIYPKFELGAKIWKVNIEKVGRVLKRLFGKFDLTKV